MALPYRTTGSLSPAFAPARRVCLAVKHPYAFALKSAISDRAEGSFVLLRYSLGVDRPSQTTHHTLSPARITGLGLNPVHARVVFQGWLHANWRPHFKASHLSYTSMFRVQSKDIVKVHGVFPSCRGYTASSQRFQFRRVSGGDSVAIVTPFVQVGTYPTRKFATFGLFLFWLLFSVVSFLLFFFFFCCCC